MRSLRFAALIAVCLHSHPASAGSSEVVADVLTGVIPLGSYGLAWSKDDKEGQRQWLWNTGVALVANSALRLAFNQTSWGERPNGHPYGFPSGHTGFIASGAAFLQERYGWQYGIPAYAMTAYVANVRVQTDHHRWRDVIAAAGLSILVAELFVTRYQNDPTRTQWTPLIGPDYVGLNWQYGW